MWKRLIAIAFIFLCTSTAWLILGMTIRARTYSSQSGLRGRVESTWGRPHSQKPPVATGKDCRTLPLESSRIDVDLDLDYRQKGLLWYSTYTVKFDGAYVFRNAEESARDVTFAVPFPAEKAVYDGITVLLDGKPVAYKTSGKQLEAGPLSMQPGQTAQLTFGYRSQGLDEWTYLFGDGVGSATNFILRMRTDFRDVDFADNTLSPTTRQATDKGLQLEWAYRNLISGYRIAAVMPSRLQPGPLAGEISFFAPVSLFFFFFMMLVVTTLRRIDLHPMNYVFLAAAFFSFHLLLAYLVDHISIHAAFAISSTVSIFLVVSYMRIAAGPRFAFRETALAQFVYLVLFSYAFFLEGYTGLAITAGAILTLFLTMQMTARIRWSELSAHANLASTYGSNLEPPPAPRAP